MIDLEWAPYIEEFWRCAKTARTTAVVPPETIAPSPDYPAPHRL
jgi:hypothetical protein